MSTGGYVPCRSRAVHVETVGEGAMVAFKGCRKVARGGAIVCALSASLAGCSSSAPPEGTVPPVETNGVSADSIGAAAKT